MAAKMTTLKRQEKKIEELKSELEKVYPSGTFAVYEFGGAGVFRITKSSDPNSLPIWILPTIDLEVSVGIQSGAAIGLNCVGKSGMMAIPGMTHLYEHLMFNKVRVEDKWYSNTELFKLASDNGVRINAGTNSISIKTHVSFRPNVSNEIAVDGAFIKGYDRLIDKNVKDPTDMALAILKGITYDHNITPEALDSEKSIVKSEINMYRNDDSYWQGRLSEAVVTKFYDELGSVEDIDNIDYMDIMKLDSIVSNAKSLRNMEIYINYWKYSVKDIISIIEKAYGIFGTTEQLKGNALRYRYINTGAIGQKPRTVKVHKTSPTKEPFMTIFFEKMDLGENCHSASVARFIQYALMAGLDRPLTKMFREDFGRTYHVGVLPNSATIDDSNIKHAKYGWCLQFNANKDDERVPANPSKFKKIVKERAKECVETVFNKLEVSEEEFNGYLDAYKKDLIGHIGMLSIIISQAIPLMEDELVSPHMESHCRGAFSCDVTYKEFKEYIKYIKKNWRAEFYYNEA